DTPFEMCPEQGDERLAADRENLREVAVGTPLSNRFDRSCRWFGPSIRNANAEMLGVDAPPELGRPCADRHPPAGRSGGCRRRGRPAGGGTGDAFRCRGAHPPEPYFERPLDRQPLQCKCGEMIGPVTSRDALTRPPPPRQSQNFAYCPPPVASRVTEHRTFCGLPEARHERQQKSPAAHSIKLRELAREQPWVAPERHDVCAE